MRQSVTTRLMLALVATFTLALGVAAQAAPAPQDEPTFAQGGTLLPARVAFVHAAPINLSSTGSAVTLTATQGDQTAIIRSGFTISETIAYLSMPGGSYTFSLYPGALDAAAVVGSTPVYTESFTLQGGVDYTVVAAGLGTSAYPFDFIPFTDTLPAAAANQGLVRIIHAAPFGPTPAQSTVDVVNQAGGAPLADDLAYGAQLPFTALLAGLYDVRIDAVALGGATILDPPPLPLPAGAIVTLVAVGDGTNYAPSIVALPFTPRAAAEVRIVHAAPFAAGDATATPVLAPTFGTAVDQVFQSVKFSDSTLYKTVPPGLYEARVVAGAAITGTVALTQSLAIQDGQRLTVVVVGTGTTTYPLALDILVDDRSEAAGSATADVRFFHAAPFAPTADEAGVDIVAQDGTPLSPPITDLDYREVSSFGSPPVQYITLPSGQALDLKVVATGTMTTVIDPDPLTLGAGSVQTVIAIGGANQQTPTLLILNDLEATVRFYLPLVNR